MPEVSVSFRLRDRRVRRGIQAGPLALGAIMALACDLASAQSPPQHESRYVETKRPHFSTVTTLFPRPEPGDVTYGIRPRINIPLSNKSHRAFWLVAGLRPPPPQQAFTATVYLRPKRSFEFEATQDTFIADVDYWLDLTVFADSALTDTLEKSVIQMRFDKRDLRAIEKTLEAERQQVEPTEPPQIPREYSLSSHYHFGVGFGWTVPLGRVSSITDIVRFTDPTPAGDLYEPCPDLHFVVGLGLARWMFELAIDARIPRLTGSGQAVVNQTRSDGRKVGVEYASFDLFGARTLTVGSADQERIRLFAGVGLGVAAAQLNAGTGYEPHNDAGIGGSAKAGADWSPFRTRHFALRLAARQQLFSAGVDIPNDVIVQLVTMARY